MEDKTYFASAERSPHEEILKNFELVDSQKFFTEIFGALTDIGAVINNNRQIVWANDELFKRLGVKGIENFLGNRPGEVISCIHSAEEPTGCGTTEACAFCGAVSAILESQKTGSRINRESRITSVIDGKVKSWDFNITSSPITLSGNLYYVLVLQDISDKKRRLILEQIFFHDLLNTASGLNGLLTILKDGANPEEARELINYSEEASRTLIDEIMHHRQILDAENGDLQVKIEKIRSREFLSSIIDKIRFQDIAKDKTVTLDVNSDDQIFESDNVLLQRVILNLLKNAIEAIPEGGSVKAGCKVSENSIIFWVQNNGIISKEVQMQIFQRSFSTKGKGRGIGTYSVRLIAENYLHGNVSFVSNEYEGTIFLVEFKKRFPADLTTLPAGK
jgi:hypothetical protein